MTYAEFRESRVRHEISYIRDYCELVEDGFLTGDYEKARDYALMIGDKARNLVYHSEQARLERTTCGGIG